MSNPTFKFICMNDEILAFPYSMLGTNYDLFNTLVDEFKDEKEFEIPVRFVSCEDVFSILLYVMRGVDLYDDNLDGPIKFSEYAGLNRNVRVRLIPYIHKNNNPELVNEMMVKYPGFFRI